jgi:hypothetical protein
MWLGRTSLLINAYVNLFSARNLVERELSASRFVEASLIYQ